MGVALENARLHDETQQALEQQTATADILRVISESPTDVQPVFDAIADRAMRLCGANIGGVARFDGEWVHLVAFHGISAQAEAAVKASFPMRPGRGAITARAILEAKPVQCPDVLADPDYELKEATRLAGYRANMAVPMMHDAKAIGAIAICREQPGEFPQRQIELLQDLRRPGRDRDRERAPVQRDARGAGPADRRRKRAQGHQPGDLRSAAHAGHADRQRDAAVRCQPRLRLPAQGRDLPPRRILRRFARVRGPHRPHPGAA